jgi:hypothetical protein
MSVGSDQGKAFVYDRSNLGLGGGVAAAAFDQFNVKAAAATAAKTAKPTSGKKDEMQSEFWFRHNQEIQKELDSAFNMAAEIQAAGGDPFGGNDPASQEFQKRATGLTAKSVYSKQLREQWTDFQTAVNGQNQNKSYTADSIKAVEEYYSKPLEELMSGNVEPPKLIMEGSDFHILQYDTELSKGLKASGKDEYSDQDVWNFSAQSMQDPKVAEAVSSQLASLPQASYDILKNIASNSGVSPEVYMRYNQLRPHLLTGTENFDFEAVEKIDTPYSKSDIESGDKTVSSMGINKKKARALAELTARSNSMYVQAGVKAGRFEQFGGGPAASFDDNVKAATEFIYQKLVNQADSAYGLSEDEDGRYGGASRKEYEQNRIEWLQDIKSGDSTRMKNAAGYLGGLKLEDGSLVSNVSATGAAESTDASGGRPVFELGGIRPVKSDGSPAFGNVPVGKFYNQYETRQYYPKEMQDEELLRLYDQSFNEVHKKQTYGVDRTMPMPSRTSSSFSGSSQPKFWTITA